MRYTVTLKFDMPESGAAEGVPALGLIEVDGNRMLRPVVVCVRQKVAGVGYDVLFDGAPVALVGDLPDLNLMLDAFNARRAPA